MKSQVELFLLSFFLLIISKSEVFSKWIILAAKKLPND